MIWSLLALLAKHNLAVRLEESDHIAFGGLLNEGKVWETAVKAMGLGWEYDYVVLVYWCQPWQALMSIKPAPCSGLMFLEVLLAWPGFLFICSTCLWGNVSSTRLQRWARVLPERLMFASPERQSSLSWIYVLLTAESTCQSKGKQSFLNPKALGWSQQHFVMELFFVKIHLE